MKIAINTRALLSNLTGVQRYTSEILNNSTSEFEEHIPKEKLKKGYAQMWEQFFLPGEVGNCQLLFSPANTGPIIHKKQILTIHDLSPIEHPEWFSMSYTTYYNALYKLLIPRVLHIIAVSEYTKRRIIEIYKINQNKITVIPNGANKFISKINYGDSKKNILEINNISIGKYILTVSSIEPRKNINNLIKAWNIVKSRIGDGYKLVICGERGNADIFKGTRINIVDNKDIIFTGRVSDEELGLLYENALIFVYLSHYEGFGLPIIEAMKCGVPVLSSAIDVFYEIGIDSQYFVDQKSIDSIAIGILDLINNKDLREDMIENGLKNAKNYEWKKCATETIELLNNYI